MNSTLPQFESSYLTPARLQWVMDVGETTVAEWIKNRELEYFKKGRLIRFAPEHVMAFINRYTVRPRRPAVGALSSGAPGGTANGAAAADGLPPGAMWTRVERLIVDQVNSVLAHGHRARQEAA